MSGPHRLEHATLAFAAVLVSATLALAVHNGDWWLYASAAVQAVLFTPWVVRVAQLHGFAWFYNSDSLQPELAGWRHPVWRGSDDWPGDTTNTYWRRTIVLRIPGKRYLVVAIPIRRKHTS